MGDYVGLAVVLFSLFTFTIVFLWGNPSGKRAVTVAARTLRSSLFAIPVWLFPFGLAVIFEAQTEHVPDVIANIFFFIGRFIFPLSYTYKARPDGLEPLLYPPTQIWDLLFWVAVSVAYWLVTRNIRHGYAFAMAPLVIVAILAIYHLCAWQLGYVHWGLPFRVVG